MWRERQTTSTRCGGGGEDSTRCGERDRQREPPLGVEGGGGGETPLDVERQTDKERERLH